ncbi:OsmC family peroxiredoxin [Lentzea sp. NPDC051213]|uniref:OsmC family peroxiredoxin n=1 Tax=Lentzea sp. NPDC051213 TaxID=3364126 RepID=UPI0037A65912
MAITQTANAHWEGSLTEGKGNVSLDTSKSGSFEIDWKARAEEAGGKTSPEELIAAAHSSCFSMALSHGLTGAGTPPTSIDTKAEVQFQAGQGVIGIHLTVRANVPGLSNDDFVKAAEGAKANCPVSKALAAVENITLDAALI